MKLLSIPRDSYVNIPGRGYDKITHAHSLGGTKLNSRVLDANIQKVVDIAERRTMLEENAAYFDDRRSQSYSIIDGLGKLAGVYRMNAGATTTITSIPADASIRKYNDEGTNSGSTSSELGNVVSLVNTLRGNALKEIRSFYLQRIRGRTHFQR